MTRLLHVESIKQKHITTQHKKHIIRLQSVSITKSLLVKDNIYMTEKQKPELKLIRKESELTIKQRQFVDEIIKGKLGSYKEAYAKVYDVTLTKQGKIPKWVEVEASKLVANPKIAQSLHKAIERKETSAVASSLRTRNYVLERLMKESRESDSDSTRVRALELLGKTVSLFSDVVETKETRRSDDIEADIEEKIIALLEEQQPPSS